MSKINLLDGVAADILDMPVFNSNFKDVMLLNVDEFVELPMIGPLLTHNLKPMLDDMGLVYENIKYAIYTKARVMFVFKNNTSYMVVLDGFGFQYLLTHSEIQTWSRIQKMYYDDVKHLANHSKRGAVNTKTLTLDEILDKRQRNGRLTSSLTKSRRIKNK